MFKPGLLIIVFACVFNYEPWKIKDNFSIRFSDKYAEGYFENLSGQIIFDSANLDNSSFSVEVKTNSINTGNKLKNKHAKSEKWLDVQRFPIIDFISDSIYKNDMFYVRGNLRIKNITQKVIIPFSFSSSGDSAIFEGSFQINRASFGLGKFARDKTDSATIWLRVPVSR